MNPPPIAEALQGARITSWSEGCSNPAHRKAQVQIEFTGAGCTKRLHALLDALKAARSLEPQQ